MKYQIVTLKDNSKLEFQSSSFQSLNNFCTLKRGQKDSECNSFYLQCFSQFEKPERVYKRCPYGLYCVGPIKWTEHSRVISGFTLDKSDLPSELTGSPNVPTESHVREYLASFDNIASEFHEQSYGYLESAIHDVRHLNGDITAHAERLLKELGYAENVEWDKSKLNSSEIDKRTLSIYCASRDISAALSMHEIAIDPKRAADDVVPTNIHKLFYRQKQINLEKLEKKKLTLQIGSTPVTKNLTKSFSLIPIVLLNNAIKYAENNSTITVRFEEGNTFRIICTNTGPIVRKDELESVFMKYRRGSNRSGIAGHGIGLWLASLVVHANVGTIEMETEEKGKDIAGRKTGRTSVVVRLA